MLRVGREQTVEPSREQETELEAVEEIRIPGKRERERERNRENRKYVCNECAKREAPRICIVLSIISAWNNFSRVHTWPRILRRGMGRGTDGDN